MQISNMNGLKKTVMVYVHKEVNSIRIGSIYLNVSFLISGFQYIRENCLTPPEISVRPNEMSRETGQFFRIVAQ